MVSQIICGRPETEDTEGEPQSADFTTDGGHTVRGGGVTCTA